MSTISRWHLSTLLYALTAAIILPATALLVYSAYTQYKQADEAAAKQAYHLAQITADNTEGFLRDAQRLLTTLASRIRNRSDLQQACDPLFAEFKDLYPQFANLSQANNAGYMVCSTNQQSGDRLTYVGDVEWFRSVQEKRRFIVAQPYVGIVTQRRVAVLAQPVFDRNGKMQGSIQLPIDLLNFRLIPGMDHLPNYITISLINSVGVVVARSSDAETFVGKNLSAAEAVTQVLSLKNGTAKSISSVGVQRTYGFVPVAGTDWYAVAGIATDEVLKDARRDTLRNLIFGSMFLSVVVVSALYLSRRISDPIVKIQATALRVASGDYDARAPVAGPAEVAQVAIQFNSMLQAIENNIRERTERQNEIYYLAFFDSLTELPNRRMLMQSLDQAIAATHRYGQISAIFYIDLDRFKEINDSYGHANGDRFLTLVAKRLVTLTRPGDTLARIAGDEFSLVAMHLGNSEEQAYDAALAIGKRIQVTLSQPFLLDHQVIDSSGSVGITLFPKQGETSNNLLQEADLAMYKAKRAGRNQIAFFEPNLLAEISERRAIRADLKQALESDKLKLHLQPQFDCDGKMVGAEALLRWHDSVRGQVSPALFIPIAEESDLILNIGKWVLEEGCRSLIHLHNNGFCIPLSINVSPRQFRHPEFVEQVRLTLIATGAEPSLLILEVTEGLLIEELKNTVERMHELAGMGIRFSIDDFGTGYSSMRYLRELPLYEIKIDRSFIHDTFESPKTIAIVQSMLSMARHLKLHVVAEGVETREQANFLKNNACDSMQGFLFARPMLLEDFLRLGIVNISASKTIV